MFPATTYELKVFYIKCKFGLESLKTFIHKRKMFLQGSNKVQTLLWCPIIYFLANEIFIAAVGVILNPCKASRAAADCTSFSNSTNAISCLPGTSLTSLKPGN